MKKLLLFLALLSATVAYGQNVPVTGRVTDTEGAPLVGATVIQAGTNNAVITDAQGAFTISAPRGEVLYFSIMGYKQVERIIDSGTVNVILMEDAALLDDVVVVGYGVQRKSSVTGAISQVKSEDMENRTITRPEQALQGKTAGVQIVQTSGAPGAAPQVRVRGYSSNRSSSPLFVVDGVRLSDIGGIDPNDIATMEVLKDAASAAIYGAEAGNGVILITTRRGRAGFSKISYDFQQTWQSLARVPQMMNSEQYIDYMTEGGYLSLVDIMSRWDGKTNTSWVDETFETAIMSRHNVALEGGNDRGTYYLSLASLNNNGIVRGDADIYKRLTASINADYKIKPWLKVGTTNQIEKYDAQSVSENYEYGSMLAAVLQMDPLTPSTYAPGNLPANMQSALDGGRTLLTDAAGNYYSVSQFFIAEQSHPFIMRDRTKSTTGGFNVNGSIFADLTPVKGLTVTSRLGYRLSGYNQQTYSRPYYANSTQSNDYAGVSATTTTNIYYQWENFANYVRKFGRHEVGAMVGMSFQKSQANSTGGSLTADGEHAILRDDPLFAYLNYPSGSAIRGVSGEETFSTKNSYFGRVSYNFDDKYFLQASLRADAADLAALPTTSRWGYFPAVSAGWDISRENFMESSKSWLQQLKLRASWGQNGSLAGLGGYTYSTDMSSAGNYPFGGGLNYTLGARPSSMGNPNLKWETSEQLDLGVDAVFLRGRLTASVDYYEKRTKDLLIAGTTPSLTIGGTIPTMNAGDVLNKGFEFELGWNAHIGGFRYGARAVMATLKNRVTYLHPSLDRDPGASFHTYPITYFEQGYPIYYMRGYQVEGIDSATGEAVFRDNTGDGVINDDDKTYIGDAIPSLTYGLTLTAGWKGFDLIVFGTGSSGNDIFMALNRPDQPAANKLKEVWYDNRWTPTNTNATVPKAGMVDGDKYVVSDAMVFNGSFFKVKQIQLGYTLPQRWTSKFYVSNLRLYVSLDDYFIFTKYPGFDPEASAGSGINSMGIDKGSYPSSRKTVFGLNLTF